MPQKDATAKPADLGTPESRMGSVSRPSSVQGNSGTKVNQAAFIHKLYR